MDQATNLVPNLYPRMVITLIVNIKEPLTKEELERIKTDLLSELENIPSQYTLTFSVSKG